MRRLLCFALAIVLALSLSSCTYYSQSAYESNFDRGYESGRSVGYLEGHSVGYNEGRSDGWDDFLYNDFQDYWEDWLYQEYGITEEQLRVLAGAPTATPSPSPTPSPTPSPSPTPTASPTPAPTPIRYGARGDEVRRIQERLNKLGFSCGAPDGVYGNMTAAAVRAFQKAARLTQTGIVNIDTSTALFSASAPRATPTPSPDPTPKKTATPRPTATPEPEVRYIGNRNTGKFHYTWCSSVDQMKSSNKVYMYYRSEATSRGYVPCKRCDP